MKAKRKSNDGFEILAVAIMVVIWVIFDVGSAGEMVITGILIMILFELVRWRKIWKDIFLWL